MRRIGVSKSTTTTGTEKQKEKRNIMGGVAWTEEEDDLLRKCIEEYGEGKWHRVPLLAGLNRCRKSCRLRWLNYLRPNIRRGRFTDDEVKLIVKLHNLLGNRWSLIAGQLRGRTANDVKNFWNCHLSKKFANPEHHQDHTVTSSASIQEKQQQQTADNIETSSSSSSLEKKKKTTKLGSSFNGSENTVARSQAATSTGHDYEYEYSGHLDNGHAVMSTGMCKDYYHGSVLATSSNVAVTNPNYNYNIGRSADETNHVDCDHSGGIHNIPSYTDQGNKEDDEFVVNFEFDEIKIGGEERKSSKWDLDDLMIMDMNLWGDEELL